MSCYQEIENDVKASIEVLAKTGIPNMEVLNDGTIFFKNKSQDDTVLLNQMRRNVEEINRDFEAVKYGSMVRINLSHDFGISIDLKVNPQYVQDQLETSQKIQQIEIAKEQEKKEAERAGLVYIPGYVQQDESMFDPQLPVTPDGYNYSLVLSKKTEFKDYLTQRIGVLKQMPDQTKAIKEQIRYLNEALKSISADIKTLENGENTIHNFFYYFNRDLININKILTKDNFTLENLTFIENYFESLSPILEVDELKGGTEGNNRFSKNLPEEIQDIEVRKLFKDFKIEHDRLKNKFREKTNEYVIKYLTASQSLNTPQDGSVTTQEEAIEDFKKAINYDGTNLAYLFLPIDGDGTNPTALQALVRKFFDDSVAKKEKAGVQVELMHLKEKLEKKLPNSKRILFGLFSSKKDYGIFKTLTSTGSYRLISKFSGRWTDTVDRVEKFLWAANNSFVQTAGLSVAQVEENLKNRSADVRKARRAAYDLLQREGAEFLELTLPEISDDNDIYESLANIENLMGFNRGALTKHLEKSNAEKQAYKEQVLKTLGGTSNNRQVAQGEYNNLVKKQLEQIFEFEAEINDRIKNALEVEGQVSFDTLKPETQAKLKNFYYKNTPFEFIEKQKQIKATGSAPTSYMEMHSTYLDSEGVQRMIHDVSTLRYVTYFPTKKESYNEDFEKNIESDETFLRVWELLKESYEFLNKNRKYKANYGAEYAPDNYDAITNQYDTAQDHALGLRHGSSHFEGLGKKFGYNMFYSIVGALAINPKKDNAKMLIKGAIKSLDEVVRNETENILKNFELIGFKRHEKLGKYMQNTKLKKMFADRGMEITDYNKTLKENIEMSVRERHFKNQDDDMIKSVVNQLATIQVFKAKKEVEIPMQFLANIAVKVNSEDSSKQNQKRLNLIQDFIKTHLYDRNLRAENTGGFMRFKVLNSEERHYTEMIKISIKERRQMIDRGGISPDVELFLQKSIEDLEELANNMGKQVSVGAMVEGLFVKMAINVGLGFNFKAQIINKAIGNLATRENDGVFWESGNAVAAMSYTRDWKRVFKSLSPKHRNNIMLTDSLLDVMAIFQNSANDISEMDKNELSLSGLRKLDNFKPLAIISAVEKSIQRPQILAMMGDIWITGFDGKKVRAFNVENTSNPHPAFEIINGKLQLKANFDTPANRDTWIYKKSAEYADNFGNSGKIPSTIAKINGDYRRTSTIIAKQNIAGAIFMVYKTWMAAHILRRYGKEGAITQLASKGKLYNALLPLAALAGMASTLGTLTIIGPFIGIGIVGATYGLGMGIKNYKSKKAIVASMIQDAYTLQTLLEKIKHLNYRNGFLAGTNLVAQKALETVGFGFGIGLKVIQQTTDYAFGKRIVSDNLINQSLMMKQSKEESNEEYARNLANMQFLLTEVATLAQIIAVKALINMFMTPDDDEKKTYDEATWEERFEHHKATMLFYLSENLLSQVGQDMTFAINPYSAIKLTTDGAIKTVGQMMLAGGKTMMGDGTYKTGINKGRSRVGVEFEKMFVPSGVREIIRGDVPTFGFGKVMIEDYEESDMLNVLHKTDFKTFESARQEIRKEYKEKQIAELRAAYPYEGYKQESLTYVKQLHPDKDEYQIDNIIEDLYEEALKKEALRRAEIEYPSIKKFFNEKGELQATEYAEFFAVYDKELAKKLAKKRDSKKTE